MNKQAIANVVIGGGFAIAGMVEGGRFDFILAGLFVACAALASFS